MFGLLGLLAVRSARADLHWTLHPSVMGPDGPTSAFATALINGNEIHYIPPAKWRVEGDRIIPPNAVSADAYLTVVPIAAPTPWTDDRAKELHRNVLAKMVPHGAKDAAIISEGVMPLQIAGQTTYAVCYTYAFYGQKYRESLHIVEHGNVQLQFHFGCLQSDYETFRAAFEGSLMTLRGF